MTYWYQKIQNPDAVIQRAAAPVNNEGLRFVTAARASGVFRDEPEVLQAFVNARVPFGVANRTMAEITKAKAKQKKSLMSQAGYSSDMLTFDENEAVFDAEKDRPNPAAPPQGQGFWGSLVNAGKNAFTGAVELLNKVASPVTAPLAAGSAQPDTAQEKWLQDNEVLQSIPVLGQTGVALVEGIADWAKGVNIVLGIDREVTPEQAAMMKQAGYAPEDWKSRYSYYYQKFGDNRRPIADKDIAVLKNQFNPAMVDVGVELVSSGYFNDPVRNLDGLSPEAQQFARQLGTSGPDSDAGRLIAQLQDNNTLSFGGSLANRFDMELGSGGRKVVAGLGDLAILWFADPLAATSNIARSTKYALHGVSANNIEDVTKALAASDDAFRPVGANAKRFDNALREVDKIYKLQQAGNIIDAAKNTERFQRLRPDMMPVFDTLMATRSGEITRIRPRTQPEQLREAAQAGKVDRTQQPFIFDSAPTGKGTPMWSLADDSAESSAKAREQLSNDLGLFVWYEAITSGRPLYQGKMLLPGQIAVNRRVRQGVANVRDALMRQDKKFMRFLNDTNATRKGVVKDLDGDILADAAGRQDILTDTTAQQWVKDHYTGTIASPTLGLSKSFGHAWKYFENSFSGKVMNFDSPESTELFRRWVVQFLPRRHAYALVNEFAAGNPAQRYGLFQQTVVASLNAAGIRNTPQAARLIDKMLKGIAPKHEVFGRVGAPLEYYTNPVDNTIKIGDADVASAVHSYQLNEGVQMPNFRELKRVLNRTSLLGYTAGALNNSVADFATRAWKVAKVANPANMVRQAMELYGFTLTANPKLAGSIAEARFTLKALKGKEKADLNDVKRAVSGLDEVDHETMAKLDAAWRTGDTATYHGIILDALKAQGIQGRAAEVLARLGETVDVRKLVPSGLSKQALAFAGPLDKYRRWRIMRAEKMGSIAKFNSPLNKELDDLVMSQYLESSLNSLGAAADNYVLMGENLGESIRGQISEGTSLGFGFLTPRVPNSYQWIDSPSTQQWAEAIQRVQADELSNLVLRRIAMEHVAKDNALKNLQNAVTAANAKGAVIDSIRIPPTIGRAYARKAFIGTDTAALANPRYSVDALDSPDAFARYLIGEDDLGRVLRDQAKRSNYTASGRLARTPEDKAEAVQNHARAMVKDLVSRLGGRVLDDGRTHFPAEMTPLLQKIADGKRVTATDLVGYKQRPEGLIAELFVPDIRGSKGHMRERLTQMMGKAYSLTVSGPLASLASHPTFLAHRRAAYDTLMPVLEQLTKKGMDTKSAAYLLESAANKRALNLTFNATDNPGEHSIFSELTDNFLMFQRAQEDFWKRFHRATTANPALLARAHTLISSAHHSGVLTLQSIQTDDGTEDKQLVFVYPGSGAITKVMSDAWNSIGGEGDELHALPQFRGFSSQLRFINPALNNPAQFSANPIIGMPFRAVRAMFPETSNTVNEWLTFLEGGEKYFAEQDTWEQYLPTALARLVPIVTKDERDGQYASALRTALVYAEAAGVLPEPGEATPDEIQRGQDAIRSMVQNIMVQRAVFGMIAPSAPSLTEPGDMQNNAHAMAEGINNLREEWFKVLEDQTRLYPEDSTRAMSEAHVEWARRYPQGKSIVNPKAFTVGSSKMVGSDKSAPSTTEATQWMLDNLDWVQNNRAIAFYLLPSAEGKYYEASPYRLQFRTELREHKELQDFYVDVATSDEISSFYETLKLAKKAKAMTPGAAQQIDKSLQLWINDWRRMHPGAAAEVDRRDDPSRVHVEVAPALGRAATGQLPRELKHLQPALQDMYNDYQTYRSAYADSSRNEKGALNKRYRDYGDRKWLGTPLESLWNEMSKYEDS